MQRALPTSALDYELPQRLIATRPAEPRDSARLLVMRRSNSVVEHRCIRDMPEYLRAGDLLVFNDTAVLPARLVGARRDTGGKVEGLFLTQNSRPDAPILWHVLLKAGGKLQRGVQIELLDRDDHPSTSSIRLIEPVDDGWIVQVEGPTPAADVLDRVGRTPLPPYIAKARRGQPVIDELDQHWYQTVYADLRKRQSVAAPTAGLHFTPELLAQVAARGVERTNVTLHVGPGTFKPVTAARLDQHRMHHEWFEVPRGALVRLRAALENPGCRIIAIGTTSVRALESLPRPLPAGRLPDNSNSDNDLCGGIAGMTDLLIAPPHQFRYVHGLLTNFHLPRSTLLALVAAMVGLERLLAVYREAIEREYRFYSYGDAMLILP